MRPSHRYNGNLVTGKTTSSYCNGTLVVTHVWLWTAAFDFKSKFITIYLLSTKCPVYVFLFDKHYWHKLWTDAHTIMPVIVSFINLIQISLVSVKQPWGKFVIWSYETRKRQYIYDPSEFACNPSISKSCLSTAIFHNRQNLMTFFASSTTGLLPYQMHVSDRFYDNDAMDERGFATFKLKMDSVLMGYIATNSTL